MSSPTVATLFQIGVDSAQIQVPQNTTVPVNPPSIPNPPTSTSIASNSSTASTNDSITLYVSGIKGFNNPLTISFFIQQVSTALDSSISPADSTTASWMGSIGSTPTNMVSGTYNAIKNGWTGTLPFTLTPMAGTQTALNTYVATNYITLFINPGLTGGAIDPSLPPSFLVNIYALDTVTNTVASTNFVLVVIPSQASYGLGVYVKTPHISSSPFSFSYPFNYIDTFSNAVTLQRNGATTVYLYYFFYPLEPAMIAPTNLNITLNVSGSVVDETASYITMPVSGTPIEFMNFTAANGIGGVVGGFTRETNYDWYGNTYITGISTSSTSTIMTDTTLSLLPNELFGYFLYYTSGPATGRSLVIASNTTDTITTSFAFSPAPTPGGGDTFQIITPNFGSSPVVVQLNLLGSPVDQHSTTPTLTHGLIQVTATDTNGVSVSAYTAIYVANS